MATLDKSGFLVSTCLFVWMTLCTEVCLGDTATCQKWAAIANSMTGNGQFTCRNNATSVCTRYDCEGSSTERISRLIEVDYCFGIQLNSCHDPLSLDFYANIPSQNVSLQHRVTHDQVFYLKDLGIPELKSLPLKPLLDFELDKDGEDSVLVSVTFKVRSSIGPVYFDQFEQPIIQEEKLPLAPCNGHLTPDPSDKPADDFMSVPCHASKYSVPSTTPKSVTPSGGKPSGTLNQTCDFIHGCAQGETCQLSQESGDQKGTCVCEPDYVYDPDLKICVSQGRVGSMCHLRRDCGIYEECRSALGTTRPFRCHCEESFSWDKVRRLCVLDDDKHKPHSHSSDDDHTHHTPSPGKPKSTTTTTTTTTTTKATPTQEPSNHTGVDTKAKKHDGASSANTKYILIGAGCVVLLALAGAGALVFRHCRRKRSSVRSSGLYDSSDTPMLTDTDDDVDLVM